jgi:hypothetical protein
MSDKEIEQVMTVNYANVFREMLLASFKTNPKLSPDYLAQPIKRQRDVEREISRLSGEMAKALVSKLKAEDYLAKKPTDQKLRSLIRETLAEFGVKE